MIRTALHSTIFKSYQVFNILYLEELLDIDFKSYSNIYIPINILIIQLHIIIQAKQNKHVQSKKIYSSIQTLTKKHCEYYNNQFMSTEDIRRLTIYQDIITLLK